MKFRSFSFKIAPSALQDYYEKTAKRTNECFFRETFAADSITFRFRSMAISSG